MGKRHIVAASLLALATAAAPGTAWAQARTLSQPSMPLAQALQRIAAEWGAPLNIDPDAVKGMTAKPVVNASSEREAVAQATRGLPVAVQVADDGLISILNDVIVVARPNEAETSVLVRGPTSSSRLGQSLRDQPRNTQVISAKLLEKQQAVNLTEALANAGGVVVNTATVQGGVSFSVRGFDSNGAVNGLPSASSSSFAAGTTLPLANIERIEVLKGPDAILLGGDNLGGTINIVTKKPNAEERLYVTGETGSFGLVRGVLDANRALTEDHRLSARVIASAATADRNFGGYRGNEDYLFAPSIRYKNSVTDVIFSATLGNQLFGVVPYTVMNTATKMPFDVAFNRPLIGGKDQGVQIQTTQFNAEVSQKVTDWLSVVVRGQHQIVDFSLKQYSPFAVLNPQGQILVSTGGARQRANTDVLDSFARVSFSTGAITHKIVGGMTIVDSDVDKVFANDGRMLPYNIFNPTGTLPPLARNFNSSSVQDSKLYGYYGQYLIGLGPIHLMAAVRNNRRELSSKVTGRPASFTKNNATTPSYGAVVDITDKLSVFGSLAYGFQPTTALDRFGARLPDIRTRNAETGVKWDLFDKRVLLNASWFSIRQSNLLDRDPAAAQFQIALPGQLGQGIDINVTGNPLRGLTVTAAFTRTNYSYLQPTRSLGNTVNGQPRDVYNLYAAYERKVADDVKLRIGAGVSGRSSSAIDRLNVYRIPGSAQALLNGSASIGAFDVTIGVRNLFDAKAYNPTRAINYIPLVEPRTWRLTVGYRFF